VEIKKKERKELKKIKMGDCIIKLDILCILFFQGNDLKIEILKKRDFIAPPKFIRYLKKLYKANLDIYKPLLLRVLIYTVLKFRTCVSAYFYCVRTFSLFST